VRAKPAARRPSEIRARIEAVDPADGPLDFTAAFSGNSGPQAARDRFNAGRRIWLT